MRTTPSRWSLIGFALHVTLFVIVTIYWTHELIRLLSF